MAAVIHIGLHKTGSTFLQNAVWPQVSAARYLTRPFTQYNHAFNKLQYADDAVYDPSETAAVLSSFEAERFLISDEALSGKPLMMSCLNRTQVARRLHNLFPDATIILFLRDQRDIMLSHYSSYVRMPFGVKSIRDLFWKPGADYEYAAGIREGDFYDPARLYYNTNDIFIHLDCFLYKSVVQLYRRLFKRVELFLYEDFKYRQQYVLARLSEIVEHPLKSVSVNDAWNRSHSKNEMVLRRALNRGRAFVRSHTLIEGASRLLAPVLPPGSKADWQAEIDRLVGDYFTDDNRALKTTAPALNWSLYPDKYR